MSTSSNVDTEVSSSGVNNNNDNNNSASTGTSTRQNVFFVNAPESYLEESLVRSDFVSILASRLLTLSIYLGSKLNNPLDVLPPVTSP